MLLEKLHYLSRGADFVVFAGSLPRGVEESFYAEAIRDLNRRGVQVVLDTEGRAAAARHRGGAVPRLAEPARGRARRRAGARGGGGLPDGARHDRRAGRAQRPHHARVGLLRAASARTGRCGATRRSRRASSRSRSSARATCCSRSSSPRSSPGKSAEEALRLAVAAGAASTLEVGAGRFDPRDVGRLAGGVELVGARSRSSASGRPDRLYTLSSLEGAGAFVRGEVRP